MKKISRIKKAIPCLTLLHKNSHPPSVPEVPVFFKEQAAESCSSRPEHLKFSMCFNMRFVSLLSVINHSHSPVQLQDKISCLLLSSLAKWGCSNPIDQQSSVVIIPFLLWCRQSPQKGKALCWAGWDSVTETQLKNLQSKAAWGAPLCDMLCFSSGLEDEHIFSRWICHVTQVTIIRPENNEDTNIGLLSQQESQECSGCFCLSTQYQRWI